MLAPSRITSQVPRDLERIIAIDTAYDAWVDAVVSHPRLAKILRKSFHIVSSYIYFARGAKKQEVMRTLALFESCVIELKQQMYELEMKSTPIVPDLINITVRVVSPMTARYYRCLSDVNDISVMMANAEFLKLIGREQRNSAERDMFLLADQVKRAALGYEYIPEVRKGSRHAQQ